MLCQNNPTTERMIYSSMNQWSSIEVLEYIHDGSIFGEWDFLCAHDSTEQLERFVVSLKKGKFLAAKHYYYDNRSSFAN